MVNAFVYAPSHGMCVRMRACLCVHAHFCVSEFARSGGGGGDRGGGEGKSERLQCWDHVIAMVENGLEVLD